MALNGWRHLMCWMSFGIDYGFRCEVDFCYPGGHEDDMIGRDLWRQSSDLYLVEVWMLRQRLEKCVLRTVGVGWIEFDVVVVVVVEIVVVGRGKWNSWKDLWSDVFVVVCGIEVVVVQNGFVVAGYEGFVVAAVVVVSFESVGQR